MVEFFVNRTFGDIVGLTSLILTLVGLSVTIWNVYRAKSAAEQAARAAFEARDQINRWQSTVDFASVISRLEALKGEHRRRNWQSALEKYTDLRRDLIAIQSRLVTLDDSQRSRLQGCIMLLARLEEEVEGYLGDDRTDMDVAKINTHVARSLDELHRTLNELRGQVPSNGDPQ